MPRFRTVAAVLSAVAMMTLFGMVAPASADTIQTANCQTKWPPGTGFTFKFTGTVYYTTNGATEHVHALGFRVHGAHTGGKSDVEYTIRENGAGKLSGHTPAIFSTMRPESSRCRWMSPLTRSARLISGRHSTLPDLIAIAMRR